VAPIHPDVPPFVTHILGRLGDAGHEAYVVGGAVRDAIMERPIADWDVATAATADQVRMLFADQRQFSLKHDTVTLVHSGAHFEVTPFRGAENDLIGDLSCRDFTVNAMALDPKEWRVIDPFQGQEDIRRRVLRAVKDPEERFREDPLRLLRCVRIAAELRFGIERGTLAGLRATAPLLNSVAPERIRDELIRILLTSRPSDAFYLMARTGILRSFLPELLEGYLKRQNPYHRHTIFRHTVLSVDGIGPDPVLRLAALLHDIGKPRTRVKKRGAWRFYGHEEVSALLASDILIRLRFSAGLTRRVVHLVRHHMIGYSPEWSDAAVRRLLRRVGVEAMSDMLALRRADLMAHGTADREMALTDELEARLKNQMERGFPTHQKDLAVDGNTVMEVTGLFPGPAVGRILRELTERILDHPEWNNRDDLTALMKGMQTYA